MSARGVRDRLNIWAAWLHSDPVHYPNAYIWLVFVSAMDAMCTWVVLRLGGVEVNPIADAVLLTHGFLGLALFKFALVALVIVLCEEVGRRRASAGLRLAVFGIAISAVPVVAGLVQLASWAAYA